MPTVIANGAVEPDPLSSDDHSSLEGSGKPFSVSVTLTFTAASTLHYLSSAPYRYSPLKILSTGSTYWKDRICPLFSDSERYYLPSRQWQFTSLTQITTFILFLFGSQHNPTPTSKNKLQKRNSDL